MIDYTIADAVNCLKEAKNLNSAVKHFLKKELRPGDPAEKFAKELRDVIERGDNTQIKKFFERHMPKFERQLFAIGGYAHWDFIGAAIERIGAKFADQFNTTYSSSESGVSINDKNRFNSIAKEALQAVDQELSTNGFEKSSFMKNIMLSSLFEPAVLEHVNPLI